MRCSLSLSPGKYLISRSQSSKTLLFCFIPPTLYLRSDIEDERSSRLLFSGPNHHLFIMDNVSFISASFLLPTLTLCMNEKVTSSDYLDYGHTMDFLVINQQKQTSSLLVTLVQLIIHFSSSFQYFRQYFTCLLFSSKDIYVIKEEFQEV